MSWLSDWWRQLTNQKKVQDKLGVKDLSCNILTVGMPASEGSPFIKIVSNPDSVRIDFHAPQGGGVKGRIQIAKDGTLSGFLPGVTT